MIDDEITTIIMGGGKGTRLGTPKIYYQFRGKPLWSIMYDKFIEHTASTIIIGLDTDPKSTRNASLLEVLKTVKTKKVLVVDITVPLITDISIQRLLSLSKHSKSATLGYFLNESVYNSYTKTYDSTNDAFKVEPIQLFDTDLLLSVLLDTPNENFKEFTEVIYKQTNCAPKIVEVSPLETYKLITKDDARIIDNLMKANR